MVEKLPPERRGEYQSLRNKKIGAQEAYRLIVEDMEIQARRRLASGAELSA